MEKMLPPTVCLDGSAVRRVREEKKLTQLYLAKVVGVTTDTISRWENNRYPSIKRENALSLAGALEIPVERILQDGTGVCAAVENSPPRRRGAWYLPAAALLAVVLVTGYYLAWNPTLPPVAVSANRFLPNYAAPGSVIPVQIWIDADKATRGFILRERFPQGWKLIESNPPASSLDNEEGMARWIVKSNDPRRKIVYLLKVAPEARPGRETSFSGEVVAKSDGRNVPIPVGGIGEVEISTVHWADLDGNHVIDDGELLQAFDTVDEMKGVHINWDQIQDVWDAGAYLWDDGELKFIPLKTTEPPASS